MPSLIFSSSGTTRRAQERRSAGGRSGTPGCAHAPQATRFWLPDAGPFARAAIDYDPRCYLFTLRCYRREPGRGLVLATPALNRCRLRELENTLVELHLTLPRVLQRYLLAALSDDVGTAEAFLPHVSSMMCCHDADANADGDPRIVDLAG